MSENSLNKKALIAMSGGVDSSVAAALMVDKGYDCMGCTMRLYENDMVGKDLFDTCCSLADTQDARAVCDRLGIDYQIYHYEAEFRENVIEPFVCSYERGETPNPCIRCNKYLKFDILYQKGREMGFDYIVTGHYARIEEKDGHYYLLKAKDLNKDQSYVLYDLTEEQLSHTFFPLGEYTKTETRGIAEGKEFVTSHKSESQDICFVPDGDYEAMIKRYRGKDYPKGNFVDVNGNVLGQHKGIIGYTIGQRRGLGIPDKKRLYVTRLDVQNNQVILGDNEDLFKREVQIRDFHWITGDAPKNEFRCSAKIRYRHKEQPGVCIINDDGSAVFTFDEPQRAITPGQSAVLYDGDYVLGGGIISNI
ncbi:tRNA-specific 2-thiouridylase [Butyrivibrio proteoclasticus]|uniref:tRNA-specific 2-thiouridylase MnmA n=1 Tax=Butyrivibrio proteoclasticus TaxID=43305 RepID=A0A1I5WKS7_9FIRM|nr:tRNA 2-thiouridine(34) synthase MnmA [Butyrivibrio proteoclasticus]SFQ20319.1 tRNA-specific 2-thiouridylase [Butyrivibrio proteoclasticus]